MIDNHHGQGMPYPSGPQFWIAGDCKLHGNVDPVIAELPDTVSASPRFCDVCGWAVPPGGRHLACEPEEPHA